MDWLVGRAGYAFIDYWTISHLGFWVVYGSTVAAVKLNRALFAILAVSGAFAWEVFERVAEKQWPSVWQSPESWWNAWISDPLTAVVSLWVAYVGFDYWRGVKK